MTKITEYWESADVTTILDHHEFFGDTTELGTPFVKRRTKELVPPYELYVAGMTGKLEIEYYEPESEKFASQPVIDPVW